MSSHDPSSHRRPPRCLVIGAGVAGSCCAIRLRKHGMSVLLVEKAEFPRSKVCGCCIGGAGLESLKTLGLQADVMQCGVSVDRWMGSLGGRRVEVGLPSGVAISRETLDPLLLQAARNAGADVRIPCRALIREMDDDCVRVALHNGQDNEGDLEAFHVVVVAGGLNAVGLSRFLPFTEVPNGPFGVAWMASCAGDATLEHSSTEDVSRHVIYMACDDDGYVGLVRLENARIDIAAALRSGADAATSGTPRERVMSILRRSRFPAWNFVNETECLTTPPLRRARQPGKGRLIAIGDAAGYSEPFTGEGMTWAMQTAIAAADMIGIHSTESGLQSIGDRWQEKMPTLLRRNKLACRAVTSLLRSPLARRAMGATLSHWPSLANPMIRHLSHGP